MSRQQQDKEKEQHWRKIIRQAALSDTSISEFCRRHGLKEEQFYWWRHKLRKRSKQTNRRSGAKKNQASFALVSDANASSDAGIEIVLGDGRRMRISKGVDEATLRAVLAAVGHEGC
jgi:hypothetical protein